MFISYFTEQPYAPLKQEEAEILYPWDHPARRKGDNVLLHSNRFFDPKEGAKLYARHIEEYVMADELGFDGIMLNEHHNACYCIQARISIMSTVVASKTKRAKIVQLGNPLPVWDNPVQLAEETSMIDMISGGRLVTGIVRAGGPEQLSNNVNPAYNRERFQEAHDLLIHAWTVPGPTRWDGEHYQVRIVNPWAKPLQQPHPRVWVPGIASKETIEFAARHAYPYVCLNTTLEDTQRIWGYYESIAQECGYISGPEHRGYLMRCHVADTEEEAIENAREFLWLSGNFTGYGAPAWLAPSGYSSWEARKGRLNLEKSMQSLESMLDNGTIVAGTPDQVIAKMRWWLEQTRPGMLMLWPYDGRLPQKKALRSLELLGKEVLPALRDIGRDLGLNDPFEIDAPVSLNYMKGRKATAAA
jgi:alkanesulfonate monooxygenase SsuD/methylene tetrahydromethanopterin reductase-like flavin-dependent oxidoreductase (luciferase family)